MARETVEVPIRARLSMDTDVLKGGTLVCRVCTICFSLVPEDFIQQHTLLAHDLEVPDNA
jgi:hypothetical protein